MFPTATDLMFHNIIFHVSGTFSFYPFSHFPSNIFKSHIKVELDFAGTKVKKQILIIYNCKTLTCYSYNFWRLNYLIFKNEIRYNTITISLKRIQKLTSPNSISRLIS